MENARVDTVYAHAEASSGLFVRESLKFAEHNDDSQVHSKIRYGLENDATKFISSSPFLRAGCAICEIRDEGAFRVLPVRIAQRFFRTLLAKKHKCFIDGDPSYPGREPRVAPKST